MTQHATNEQILTMLQHINDKIDRLVWRADQTEKEIDGLKTRLTVLETVAAVNQNSLSSKLGEKAGYVVVGIMLTYVAKQLGLV